MIEFVQIRRYILVLFGVLFWHGIPLAETGAGDTELAEASDLSLQSELLTIKQAFNELRFDDALALLLETESSDDPSVLMLRAFCHEFGLGVVIDASRAREIALQATESKDWEAAQFLAWQSITGHVGAPNLMESGKWRDKSIEWKSPRDHEPVLPDKILVPEKNGYVPRYELVNPWIQEKALDGDPVAQYNLYKTLIDGRSAYANVNQAMSWLQKSAEGGLPLAAVMMAFYYEHGFILQKNPQMEIKYLRIAAQSGNAGAQYKLGMRLLGRAYTDEQVAAACEYLEKAASQGVVNSQYRMGQMLFEGKGIKRDLEAAFKWYRLAAEKGHEEARLQALKMEGFGWGTQQNEEQLVEFYRLRISRLPDVIEGNADTMLALLEEHGWDDGSPEERLVKALRLADDPVKKEFVRDAFLQYKVDWFRENVVLPIAEAAGDPEVEAFDDAKLKQLINLELKQRSPRIKTHPPKPVYQPAPLYPRGFKAFEVEETVKLMLVVDSSGRVREHAFLASPLPQFKAAIEDILPYWRFIPGSRGNKPVVTRVRISIPFRIKQKNENL